MKLISLLFSPANWTRFGALTLAILIWVNVAFHSTYTHTFTVPVQISGVSTKLIPVTTITTGVDIMVEATGGDLFRLWYSKPTFAIDGKKFKRGKNRIPLRVADLDIPKSIITAQVRIVEPKLLSLQLDKLLTKTVIVRDNITLMPKAGWVAVGVPVIKPQKVLITGPAARVKKITQVITDTLRLEGISGEVRRELPVSGGSPTVICTPPRVLYTASIQRLTERRIKKIPVKVLRVPQNIEAILDAPTISLTLIGGEDIVSGLTRDDLEVTVDYQKLEQNPQKTFAASIKIPEHVRWVRASPQRFGLKEKIIIRKR